MVTTVVMPPTEAELGDAEYDKKDMDKKGVQLDFTLKRLLGEGRLQTLLRKINCVMCARILYLMRIRMPKDPMENGSEEDKLRRYQIELVEKCIPNADKKNMGDFLAVRTMFDELLKLKTHTNDTAARDARHRNQDFSADIFRVTREELDEAISLCRQDTAGVTAFSHSELVRDITNSIMAGLARAG
jgi:hypothetical protein